MRISPLVAYRPEHGFLTTSTLYGRLCHILHTCTLNSSPLSVYDTPVGLGLNAAAWMTRRPAYLVSFDQSSPSLIWYVAVWTEELATATMTSLIMATSLCRRTCCGKHMDLNIVGSLFRHPVRTCMWRGGRIWGVKSAQFFPHQHSVNSNLMAH